MLNLLKTHFGFDQFLPLQREIIDSVMASNDNFVLMPTGGGKSLCYQLPALALDGLTLVVSPLIALMKDQVDSLRANGVPAGFMNSTLTATQVSRVRDMVRQDEIKILYVAPERATLPEFQQFLTSTDVSLLAIDEAHCVSEWGHEFRPAYGELHQLRRFCPNAPVIALTATATRRVREDILSQLGLRQPKVFTCGFDRPNLTYSVRPKAHALPDLLQLLEQHRNESTIVYCLSRKATEELARDLSAQGFKAEPYHAGLEPQVRRTTQERFTRDAISIVTATIAFGMGIDKPDIRLVVHYDLPKSVEGYYQETGRAGRDGLPSECVLYYSPGDRSKHEFFIDQLEDLAEQDRARERLDRILELCTLTTCRRTFLLEYLGEARPAASCRGCDVCLMPRESYDASEIAQMTLSAVVRTGERFGAKHAINVLLGAETKQVLANGHQHLPTFGVARGRSLDELRELIPALTSEGLLQIAGGKFPTLSLTLKGRAFLKNRESLTLTRPVAERTSLPRDETQKTGYDEALFRELSVLRKSIADERGVPAFVIFGNKTLQEMARTAPRTPEAFATISGVGEAKLSDFSSSFVDLISRYVDQHGIAKSEEPDLTTIRKANGVNNSSLETARMVSAGASMAEVADRRGLKENTLLGQLERLVRAGKRVEFQHLLPNPEGLETIEAAFQTLGYDLLRPVFEQLRGEFSYQELRLVRLGLYQRLTTASRSGPDELPQKRWGSGPRA